MQHMSFLSLILSLREIESEVQWVFLAWQEKGSAMGVFLGFYFLFMQGKPKAIRNHTSGFTV